jgi:AcrR family transcriptional regulator
MNALDMLTRAYASRDLDPAGDDATARRILDAARKQLELFGIQRTTMEDVARRSGVSRVTVYRHFPTKERLLEAVILHEVQRFLAQLGALMDTIDGDEQRIIEGFVFTVRTLRRHPLLQRLLEGEPELFLPQLTTGAGPLIGFARSLIVDYTRRRTTGLNDNELAVAAEVGIRLTLSLILTPESGIDLDDTDGLRRFAARYVAPFVDDGLLRRSQAKRRGPKRPQVGR